MKSRAVPLITTTEEEVRLRIYEGKIPLGEAGAGLLEMTLAAYHHADRTDRTFHLYLERMERHHKAMMTPWPVRWWRYYKQRRQEKSA